MNKYIVAGVVAVSVIVISRIVVKQLITMAAEELAKPICDMYAKEFGLHS